MAPHLPPARTLGLSQVRSRHLCVGADPRPLTSQLLDDVHSLDDATDRIRTGDEHPRAVLQVGHERRGPGFGVGLDEHGDQSRVDHPEVLNDPVDANLRRRQVDKLAPPSEAPSKKGRLPGREEPEADVAGPLPDHQPPIVGLDVPLSRIAGDPLVALDHARRLSASSLESNVQGERVLHQFKGEERLPVNGDGHAVADELT
jgi:hypothetical protein